MPRIPLALLVVCSALLTPGWLCADSGRIRVTMLERSAATFYVTGRIDGFGAVELMVDTGSGYTAINEETLAVLQRRAAARYVKQLKGVLADGSELEVPVYAIRRMRIGEHCWLTDVQAAVLPGASRQILGLSALRKVAPFVFSVDPPGLVLSGCERDVEPVAGPPQTYGPLATSTTD